MWSEDVILMILNGVKETLYMTLASTILGYVLGLPMGICLAVSDKDGLNKDRYRDGETWIFGDRRERGHHCRD